MNNTEPTKAGYEALRYILYPSGPQDIETTRRLLRNLTTYLSAAYGLTRSCVNCEHFAQQAELCNLAMSRGVPAAKARPPAWTIARGCDDWKDDDIPF